MRLTKPRDGVFADFAPEPPITQESGVLLDHQREAGIPEEALLHSYERFYQAESLWAGKGNGLELASILL